MDNRWFLEYSTMDRLVDCLRWGETDVSELRFYGPIIPPRVIRYLDHGMMVSAGLTPNLSTRALWQPPVLSGDPAIQDISGASGRVGEGNEN
jgi:hypothetical protein